MATQEGRRGCQKKIKRYKNEEKTNIKCAEKSTSYYCFVNGQKNYKIYFNVFRLYKTNVEKSQAEGTYES